MSETLRFVERLGSIYRVLIEELNGYWLIDCDSPSPPFFEIDCGKYVRVPTPESWMTEQTTPAQEARLRMIQPLLDCDDCISDKALRYRDSVEGRLNCHNKIHLETMDQIVWQISSFFTKTKLTFG